MQREQWKSRLGFIWAAVGSAIGLGSIWRFPYVVGDNGGASFILLYLLCLILVGIPVLIAEITVGRTTSLSPYGAFTKLSGSRLWGMFGKMTVLTGFLVSTFYAVVAGITFGYLLQAIFGSLMQVTNAREAEAFYTSMTASSSYPILLVFLFMATCFLVLYYGVQKGIEAWNKILMPLLLIVLFALAVRGLSMPGGDEGLNFLLRPDFSKWTPAAFVMALGQAFFSLSLGQGTMVTYGSYLKSKENVITTALPVSLFGILVSLLAGLAIFSIVFSYGLSPGSGQSLMFQTLPVVFSNMPGGYFFGVAFFVLLFIAALTSEISALEPMIAYLADQWKISRGVAVFSTCTGSFLIAAFCTNAMVGGASLFGVIEFLSINILVPIGGFVVVLLVGWKWGIKKALAEMKHGAEGTFTRLPGLAWYLRVSICFIAPIIIAFIFFEEILSMF